MRIDFLLNGKTVNIETHPSTRLSNILRDHPSVRSVRPSCSKGECKSCSVIFNGDVTASCLIPAFEVRGSKIVTLEGFSKTSDYMDIEKALDKTGVNLCDNCMGSTILTIQSILERFSEPTENQILDAFKNQICPCTNINLTIKAVKKAAYYRKRGHAVRK